MESEFIKEKAYVGSAKKIDVTDKNIEVKALRDDIQAKENTLKVNKEYLGVLADMNLNNAVFSRDLNYYKFTLNRDIDEYIDDRLNEYFNYNEQILDLTLDTFKDVKDDGIDDIMDKDLPSAPSISRYVTSVNDDEGGQTTVTNYGGYALALIEYQSKIDNYVNELETYESYLDGKYSAEEGKVKLEDSRKLLKSSLKNIYYTISQLENTIDQLSATVNSTNEKLKFAKESVDNGLMTLNDYKAKELAAKDLEINLRKLVNTHNSLVNKLEKPWILNN